MAKDKGLTLYEHVEALAVVDTWFDEFLPDIEKAEGEVPEALAALLDIASGDFNEKAERVALKINNYLAEALMVESARDAILKGEVDRLTRRAKRIHARAEYLKRYLHFCLTKARVQKVNGLLLNVRLQKNPPSVRGEVPVELLAAMWLGGTEENFKRYVRYAPAVFTLDRRAVVDAWKAGDVIPDGLTVEQDLSLRID